MISFQSVTCAAKVMWIKQRLSNNICENRKGLPLHLLGLHKGKYITKQWLKNIKHNVNTTFCVNLLSTGYNFTLSDALVYVI